MVLLTYQAETAVLQQKDSLIAKSECPKTAYIDKLGTFNEVYADEERCDLFFICQDGEIPAHRLVISNASKLIMAMQDDQPPWYPVYISVPDLNREIVNTLVRLAYTGQMEIPPGTTSDELLDAMQTLGWVNTDCLTATYLDSSSGSADEDFFAVSVSSKTAESLETVLKMNLPAAKKGETDNSDDDDGMEVPLPEVPMSDEDEGKLKAVNNKSLKKKEVTTKRTRQAKPVKTQSPSKAKPVTTNNKKREQSPKQTVVAPKSPPPESPSNARKGSRRNNEDAVKTTPAKDEQPEVTTNTIDAVSEPLRSRTRTIRKPKKFDDAIVLTPTKRKESPSKSPSKPPPPPKTAKANEVKNETETPKKSAVSKKATNDVKPVPANKNRGRSTSSESKDSPRNSLITSYFNKRSPRKSNDAAALESETAQDGVIDEANNIQNADGVTEDASKDITTDSAGTKDADTKANNAATTRKRARSTASTKSDKETPPEDAVADTDVSAKNRKKKSVQENSEEEPVDSVNPVKRGRKASTMSNASKASNKESIPENELEASAENPRTRRSRQE